jgi:NADPH:quinone reductase-like Zn-dependent oxidoreductase
MESMKALRFAQYGPPSVLSIEQLEKPQPAQGESLVQIHAAAVNPSDVKNVAGAFKTPLPRTPGRDYAGTVVAGDDKGREVWGSGAGFGVQRDGSHAEFVVIPSAWLSDKPPHLSMEEAATVGVPFVVAWNGLVQEGDVKAGETILVTGALGAVGRAVTQIAHWKGARVIGADIVERPCECDVYINAKTQDLVAEVKAATSNYGVDLVFDAVGGPMFEQCLKSLRVLGRQIAMASVGTRRVSFDLIDFYHGRQRLIGVDSLQFAGAEIAAIMDAIKPGFEGGALKPFETKSWPLDKSIDAYTAAEKGSGPEKQVLIPAAL